MHTSRAFSFSFSLCRSLESTLSFPPGLLLCSKSLTMFMYSWWTQRENNVKTHWIYPILAFQWKKKTLIHTKRFYIQILDQIMFNVVVSPVAAALYQPGWMWAAGWWPHGPAVSFWFDPAAPGTAAPERSPSPRSHHLASSADCSDPGGGN